MKTANYISMIVVFSMNSINCFHKDNWNCFLLMKLELFPSNEKVEKVIPQMSRKISVFRKMSCYSG